MLRPIVLLSWSVIALLSWSAGAAPPPSYWTQFDSSEIPLSEGGKWITGKGAGLDWNDPQAASGRAHASVLSGLSGSRYDDSIAHLSTQFIAFGANQYAQATVHRAAGYTPPNKHEIELLLRFRISPRRARGYEVLWGIDGASGQAYVAIVRWNGPRGKYTALSDPGPGSIRLPRDGDVLRAEMIGTRITVYLNGRSVATAVDSTYATGQPGLGFWPVDSAIKESYGWTSFQAGML